MEIFSIFAQSSIAIIAFTSIVAQFKRKSDPDWNPFLFMGMVTHSFFAFFGSILPFFIEAFTEDRALIWTICGWTMGSITFFHALLVMFHDQSSKPILKAIMMSFSTLVTVVQVLNIFEIGWTTNHGAYAVILFWHIYQSLFIFALLINSGSKKRDGEEVLEEQDVML